MSNPDILPAQDEHGNQINDSGKRVLVRSIGGAVDGVRGTVVSGPTIFMQPANYRKMNLPRKPTCWYWEVLLDGWGRTLHFALIEISFE